MSFTDSLPASHFQILNQKVYLSQIASGFTEQSDVQHDVQNRDTQALDSNITVYECQVHESVQSVT